MNKQKVYLAGGFHSSWRDEVKTLGNVVLIDPKKKEANRKFSIEEIGSWDLHYIKQCDVCFVYMDAANPSGYGLAVEAGYAKGLGKTVVLVLETNHAKIKYLQFLTTVADVTFSSLKDGMDFIKTLI